MAAVIPFPEQSRRPKPPRRKGDRETLYYDFLRWGFDAKGWSKRTRDKYYQRARQADLWLTENEGVNLLFAGERDLRAYVFSTPPSVPNRNSIRVALIGFCDFLIDRGYMDTNPAKALPRLSEPARLPRPLEDETASIVWKSAQASGPLERALVAVLLFGGLRKTETRLLEWSDIASGWIRVRSENAKGSKERRVPLHAEAAAALDAWRVVSREARWVFPSPRGNGHPISETHMRQVIYDIGDRVGVERLAPHQFRHTCATSLLDKGADTRDVQVFLGHASLQTTQIYTRVRPARLKDAVGRLRF